MTDDPRVEAVALILAKRFNAVTRGEFRKADWHAFVRDVLAAADAVDPLRQRTRPWRYEEIRPPVGSVEPATGRVSYAQPPAAPPEPAQAGGEAGAGDGAGKAEG